MSLHLVVLALGDTSETCAAHILATMEAAEHIQERKWMQPAMAEYGKKGNGGAELGGAE